MRDFNHSLGSGLLARLDQGQKSGQIQYPYQGPNAGSRSPFSAKRSDKVKISIDPRKLDQAKKK